MDEKTYKTEYAEYKEKFENYAREKLGEVKTESKLAEAMKYSLFAGGKRVRPVLLLAACDFYGADASDGLPFALALECIHTYSLIHDDLPALDNDVLRRGNPTNHVKYGEATAILAGDALLNYAYELLFENCKDKKSLEAARYIAKSGGYSGMVGGQQFDMEMQASSEASETNLIYLYGLKTGKLLACPFAVAKILAGKRDISDAEEFGYRLGELFQLADDYKDAFSSSEKIGKSVGKDEVENKLSALALYGKTGAEEKIMSLSDKLKKLAKTIDKSGFLECFINSVSDV